MAKLWPWSEFKEIDKMKLKLFGGALLALAILAVGAGPISAQIRDRDIVPGIIEVNGQIGRSNAPVSVEKLAVSDDARAIVFIEQENFTLQNNIALDVRNTGTIDTRGSLSTATRGTVTSGTEINSYLLNFDPTGFSASLPGVSGRILFEQDVLGLILISSTLNATSGQLGADRTTYRNMEGVDFSEESVTISSNRRLVSFNFRNNAELNQVRIITLPTGSNDSGGSGGGNNNGGNNGNTNAPVARDESVSTNENRSITIDVLDNDTDANNNIQRSSLRVTTSPSNGSTSINSSSREITYDPDNNFTGTDSFVYEICDSSDLCDRATVTVTVRSTGSNNNGGNGGSTGDLTLRTLLPEANDCGSEEDARIDIIPGNRENEIRLDDETGYTPVAILSTRDFPAPNCVDVSTVTFGPSGNEARAISCGVVNVNFDRWDDVVCDFKTSELGFSTDDTMGSLQADSIDGGAIDESDDVTVLMNRRPKNFIPSRGSSNSVVKAQQLGESLYLMVQAQNVAALEIQVFNAQGQSVFKSASEGRLLRWNMKSSSGSTLANGVYIYVVRAYDAEGNVVSSSIHKIGLIR